MEKLNVYAAKLIPKNENFAQGHRACQGCAEALALRQIGLKMYPPQEGMQVLDIGCGTGVHLKMYQEKGCQVMVDHRFSLITVLR